MSEAAKVFADDILMPVGRAVADGELRTNRELTGFLAMEGKQYRPSKLMVIGRAVNGWVAGTRAAELTDSAVRNKFALKVQERSATPPDGCSCPMSWVTTQWGATDCYNTKRSPFWRVIRRVVYGLSIASANDRDWSSHLVWSNLYKLSPEAGRNPSSGLMRAQLEGCKKLNALELETYCCSLVRTGQNRFLTHCAAKAERAVSTCSARGAGISSAGVRCTLWSRYTHKARTRETGSKKSSRALEN